MTIRRDMNKRIHHLILSVFIIFSSNLAITENRRLLPLSELLLVVDASLPLLANDCSPDAWPAVWPAVCTASCPSDRFGFDVALCSRFWPLARHPCKLKFCINWLLLPIGVMDGRLSEASAFRSAAAVFESGASSESKVEHKFGCDCPNSRARWFLGWERGRMISLKSKLWMQIRVH